MSTIKPIFLLADSQLLFWREEGEPFLARARKLLDEDGAERAADGGGDGSGVGGVKAAYLGASNGDAPEFYELFVAAMEQIGIGECRHVPAVPSAEDLAFFGQAELILLGGGEVERGWDSFKAAGLDQKLIERYYGGALLIGVSAGAVQLGLKGWDADGRRSLDMLRIVPFVVDAHDEPGWSLLLRAVPKAGEHSRGLGIPSGGGALYHPDYSIEPLRHPVVEVSQTETGLKQALLFPGELSLPAAAPGAGDGDGDGDGDGGDGRVRDGGDGSRRGDSDVTKGDGPPDPPDANGANGANDANGANGKHRANAKAEAKAGSAARVDAALSSTPPADGVDRERRELGYRVTADGTIEILRQGEPAGSAAADDEPVN